MSNLERYIERQLGEMKAELDQAKADLKLERSISLEYSEKLLVIEAERENGVELRAAVSALESTVTRYRQMSIPTAEERAKGEANAMRLEWMGHHDAHAYVLFPLEPIVWRVIYRPYGRPDHTAFADGPTMCDAIDAGRKATEGGS